MYRWGAGEVLSEEALGKNLRTLNDERKIFDRLRTHFRKLILSELLAGPGARDPVPVSIRSRAIGSLIVEWLLVHNCHYTLCMLTSEMPCLTDLPELSVRDPKRREPDNLKEILDALHVYDEETGDLYYNSNDTLISCFFKVAHNWKSRLKFRNNCAGDFEGTPPRWAEQLREVVLNVGGDPAILPQLQSSLSRLVTKIIDDALEEERAALNKDLINREQSFQRVIKKEEAKVYSKIKDIEDALAKAHGRADLNLTVKKDLLVKLLADVKEQHKSVVDGLNTLQGEESLLERNRRTWQIKVLEETKRLEAMRESLEKKSNALAEEKERLRQNREQLNAVQETKKVCASDAKPLKGPPEDTMLSPRTSGSLKAVRRGELQPVQTTPPILHTQSLDAITTYSPGTHGPFAGESLRSQIPRGSERKPTAESATSVTQVVGSLSPRVQIARPNEIRPLSNSLAPKEPPLQSTSNILQQSVQSQLNILPQRSVQLEQSAQLHYSIQPLPSVQQPIADQTQESCQPIINKGPLYPHPAIKYYLPTQSCASLEQSSGAETVKPAQFPNYLLKPTQDTKIMKLDDDRMDLRYTASAPYYKQNNSSTRMSRSERSRSPIHSASTSSASEAVDGKGCSKRLSQLREEGRRVKAEFEAYKDSFDDDTSDSCDEGAAPHTALNYLKYLQTHPYKDNLATQVSFPNLHEGIQPCPELHHLNSPRRSFYNEMFGQGDVASTSTACHTLTIAVPNLPFLDKIVNRTDEKPTGVRDIHSMQGLERILESVRTADAAESQIDCKNIGTKVTHEQDNMERSLLKSPSMIFWETTEATNNSEDEKSAKCNRSPVLSKKNTRKERSNEAGGNKPIDRNGTEKKIELPIRKSFSMALKEIPEMMDENSVIAKKDSTIERSKATNSNEKINPKEVETKRATSKTKAKNDGNPVNSTKNSAIETSSMNAKTNQPDEELAQGNIEQSFFKLLNIVKDTAEVVDNRKGDSPSGNSAGKLVTNAAETIVVEGGKASNKNVTVDLEVEQEKTDPLFSKLLNLLKETPELAANSKSEESDGSSQKSIVAEKNNTNTKTVKSHDSKKVISLKSNIPKLSPRNTKIFRKSPALLQQALQDSDVSEGQISPGRNSPSHSSSSGVWRY